MFKKESFRLLRDTLPKYNSKIRISNQEDFETKIKEIYWSSDRRV